jgi:hypothetical protein
MNKKIKIISILIIITLLAAATVYAAGPGSTEDPLVTKSYVDEQIRQLIGTGTGGGGGVVELVVEELKVGQILIAGAGTEFILRGGKATAYGDGANGIPNLTSGADIKIGNSIPLNHLLLFPRDDERGIKITAGPAFVMIRGPYSIR